MDAESTRQDPLESAAAALLDVARRSLAEALERGRTLPPDDLPRHGLLGEPAGVFVTLRRTGHLRGCIGVPIPELPMVEACWQAAQQAALEDPRFEPVTAGELRELDLEVSVLSPWEELERIEDFVTGRDGAVLEAAGHRSLFLPTVGIETGWETEEFFDHLALKAGLPPDAWRDPQARLHRFTAVTSEGPALPAAGKARNASR
jgi:AmmeMemoRadiSam system protein A